MSNPKSNYPPAQLNQSGEEIAAQVRLLNEIRTWPKPETDQEVEQTIDRYIDTCIRLQIRPGIEGMALACHVTRQTLWNWEVSQSRRGKAVSNAKQLLSALLEQWALSGRLNPATHCFLAKNHFGYTDTSEVSIIPKRDITATMSPEAIIRDIPVDILDDHERDDGSYDIDDIPID